MALKIYKQVPLKLIARHRFMEMRHADCRQQPPLLVGTEPVYDSAASETCCRGLVWDQHLAAGRSSRAKVA